MNTLFDDVGEFHRKFGLNSYLGRISLPKLINDDALVQFRLNFLKEELKELEEAYANEDLSKIADALADLVYVALGTAHLHSIPFMDVWKAVHIANMSKIRATRAEQSTRGSTFDVVKPSNFVPPDIEKILNGHGYRIKK